MRVLSGVVWSCLWNGASVERVLTLVSDVVVALSVLATAIFVYLGLSTWKAEQKGQRSGLESHR